MLPAFSKTISEPLGVVNTLTALLIGVFLLISGEYQMLFTVLTIVLSLYALSIVLWRSMNGWFLLMAMGVCCFYSHTVIPMFMFMLFSNAFLLYYYYGRPWRRVHYPMMRVYASALGSALGFAQARSKKFDPDFALGVVALHVNPKLQEEQLARYLSMIKARCQHFNDETTFTDYLANEVSLPGNAIACIIDNLRDVLRKQELLTLAQMIIADVIENRYGEKDRNEYIYALITGAAK